MLAFQVRTKAHLECQLRKLSFAIIRSPTKLLPAWYRALLELGFKDAKMPRDVATRWNSTYILLEFCLKHRVVIVKLTNDRRNGLRACEMEEAEWVLVEQLRDVLKVSRSFRLARPDPLWQCSRGVSHIVDEAVVSLSPGPPFTLSLSLSLTASIWL